MHEVREAFGTYNPVAANSNGTLIASGDASTSLGGFVCAVSGTLVLADSAGGSILQSTPVTAGACLPLPFKCPKGCVYTLGGGAAGTFFYG